MASSNGRDFAERKTPKGLGLRDVLAVADGIWACGERGHWARWVAIRRANTMLVSSVMQTICWSSGDR